MINGAGNTKTAADEGYWSSNKTARQSAPTLTPGLTDPHSKHRAEEG